MERVEFWHSTASDTRFVWFPFNFLKPNPTEEIDLRRIFKMTICFGFYYGVFAALRGWIFSKESLIQAIGQDIFFSTCIFAIWFSAVTAPLWNKRAQRLIEEKHETRG